MIFPENFEHKIDFVSIRQQLYDLCSFLPGKEEVERMAFSTNIREIELMLDETDEMCRILTDPTLDFPAGAFYDVRDDLARIRVEGLFLDEKQLFSLRKTLESTHALLDFLRHIPNESYPALCAMAQQVQPVGGLIREIDRVLDKFGRVKDTASPELAQIRKELLITQSSVSRLLTGILRQAQADGYVEKDASPALREGRLVIPVSPAYKRKLGGIVHDESATGKTVFVEPARVVEANNRIRELEGEERREIIRILTQVASLLRPHIPDLMATQLFLGHIDFLRAKARWAERVNAIRPHVVEENILQWVGAKHPLLLMALQKQGKKIVPLDITLSHDKRILLISGPNAGGKSVCLKTVALLQYMLQCGMPLPLQEQSLLGIFSDIFIDIGDEQSIEDDLSTYSSHLRNMKFFLRYSTEKSLLLIDEFGGGTEPQIGGAIAESILAKLNDTGAYGVITTHYTNLKLFAEDTMGIENGAMLYDRHNMQPLFQLEIGRPGSSFAVEIARKIGLPEHIIQMATEIVGTEQVDYDKYLQDIARDKRYWENKRQKIRLQEKKLEETIARYEGEMNSIHKTRKELINQAKKEAMDLLQQSNAVIENTIRKIKESQADKENTKAARQDLEAFKEKIAPAHPQKVKKQKVQNVLDTLKVGDSVTIKGQSMIGHVLDIQGKKLTVAMGQLKTTLSISEVEKISNNQMRKQGKMIPSSRSGSDEIRRTKLSFKQDIDLRGMRADEAVQAVMYFIDDAVMVGAGTVRILHGTGTGALRQAIRQYLSTVASVKSFRDEHIQLGGVGITVVELDD